MFVAQSKSSAAHTAGRQNIALPALFLVGMVAFWLLLDAVLPLLNLYFVSAQLVPLSRLFLLPTRVLFPGRRLSPSLFGTINDTTHITRLGTWGEVALLLVSFLLLFLCYLLAVRILSRKVNIRYILVSTLILGIVCILIPVVTSPDLFSYISYARMEVLYHLNPLTTAPQAIPNDVVSPSIYWKDQPSAYGPIWVGLTSLLQWFVVLLFGPQNIGAMVIVLRLLGLCAHLWSTAIIWSLSGHLQRQARVDKPYLRILATLAYAWNPLLLFEACVNAHNDTVMLLLILLGLWILVRSNSQISYVWMALLFALATCLKANVALLLPGVLLYVWLQPRRIQGVCSVLLVYIGTIVVLYAPFWDAGAILKVLAVNPGTFRNQNTLVDFLGQFYNGIRRLLTHSYIPDIGSHAERITHTLSVGLFGLVYALFCLQALIQRRLSTPLQLIQWMTTAWFLYCILGAPWFWPWYAVTFFGLFALVEASVAERTPLWGSVTTIAARVFAFTLLTSYCFVPWGMYNYFMPLLEKFRWAYFRGLWIWLPVVVFLFILRHDILSVFHISGGRRSWSWRTKQSVN